MDEVPRPGPTGAMELEPNLEPNVVLCGLGDDSTSDSAVLLPPAMGENLTDLCARGLTKGENCDDGLNVDRPVLLPGRSLKSDSAEPA